MGIYKIKYEKNEAFSRALRSTFSKYEKEGKEGG